MKCAVHTQLGPDVVAALAEERLVVGLKDRDPRPPPCRAGRRALGAFKAAMAVRGIITDARTNPPLPPLVDTEVKAIAAVLDELGLGRSA